MYLSSVSTVLEPVHTGTAVLLVSPDPPLFLDLQTIFHTLGLRLMPVTAVEDAMTVIQSLHALDVVLLDARLPGLANGRLLTAMHEAGVHSRCAIALVAGRASDEWIARLREGEIDDIVPSAADASAWRAHLSTMRRGHRLHCELEQMRAAAMLEVQRDHVTGAFHRETMLTLLFRETDRVQRLRGVLSVMLFAIDEFGRWKRELGREGSDALLREVTARAGRALRSYDLLGRIGESQFLIALPGCVPGNAEVLADRLRMEVFGGLFLVRGEGREPTQLRLSASIAIVSSRGRSPVVVLREAEETLARAQRNGPGSLLCAHEPELGADPESELVKLFPEAGVLI